MAEIPAVKPVRPRVVVVGGGFAGLSAGLALAGMAVDVTLIDRRNHHTFQPLLYQVALAVLSPADIAQPIRHIFSKDRNIEVLMDEVENIKFDQNRVQSRSGAEMEYDYLILATGATHSYFGKDQWAQWAPGLKTVEDATEIRRRVLLAFAKEGIAFGSSNSTLILQNEGPANPPKPLEPPTEPANIKTPAVAPPPPKSEASS